MTEHGARAVLMGDGGESLRLSRERPSTSIGDGAATFVSVKALIALPTTTRATGVEWNLGTLPGCRLRRVTQYIQEHLDQDLTLAELAAVVHMSPYHFARLFKGSTGVPPHRFVVRKRIDRAISLLASQELSIARIARLAGFRTPSHFANVFHRVTGITPRACRAERLRQGRSGKGEQHGPR
jgi:AraC-like DNA-binding protein